MLEFIKRLLTLVRPYRTRLILGILCGILTGLSALVLVVATQFLISVMFPSSEDTPLANQLKHAPAFIRPWLEGWLKHFADQPESARRPLIIFSICLIPLVAFGRGLVSYLNVYFMEWVSVRAITDLRVRLFNHLLNLSVSFLNRSSTGDLMARVTNDTSAMQRAINSCLPTLVKDPVTVVALGISLFVEQPRLTLISMIMLPAAIVPVAIYSRKVRKAARGIQNTFAELSAMMQEAFTGIRIIKAYNLEPTVLRDFNAAARRYISFYMRVIRSLEIPGPLIELFGAIGVAALLICITLYPEKVLPGGKIDAASLWGFVAKILLMYPSIKALVRLQNQLTQANAASERVFELLAEQNNVPEPAKPAPLRAANADIHFDAIDFDYGDKPILRGIDLKIKAGSLVALVGQTGSGKTTLTNLLLRFYDPRRGAVRIGGVDLREFSTPDLRSQIAVVAQETILFNDTIRGNIAVGRPGSSSQEIESAARHAHAHEFILEKPQGYDTIVGEKGVTLSGGQRQRIAIARAIVRNAPILILDEATSSVDSETEKNIQAALEELLQGRTTICIAHRLSTIQKADLIVVMDHGRIVEAGTHAQLIKSRGLYSKLHDLQFQQAPA
jgi:subfamily B ATP-binding cassette protein MsbA